MPDDYRAVKRTVGEILAFTSPAIKVPEWQRDFSWDTTEVDAFWRDLVAFSDMHGGDNVKGHEYFLGSVVLVDDDSGNDVLLLDGQQRLATATILLSVLRDIVKPFREEAATRLSHSYIAAYDDATGETQFKLTMNVYDRDYFRREVQDPPIAGQDRPVADLHSHKLIRQTRDYFRQRVQEAWDAQGGGEPAFKWVLRIRQIVTDHMSVVAVTSSNEDNASTVFETLNDRGIGLSTPDLIRSLLLRRAVEGAREEIIDCWRDVLEVEEESSVEEFLRHYWLSIHGDIKAKGLYRVIKADIETRNVDSLQFSRDLQQTAILYGELVAARDSNADLKRLLESVKLLAAKSLMPAILSAYAVGNTAQKVKFIRSLLVLYVRHTVIGNRENSRLESVVFDVARELRTTKDFEAAITRLKDFAPSDEEFDRQFRTAQISRIPSARYVLREIEHQMRITAEVAVEAPDRVHVEHIYPQKPLPGARWANHATAINRLGNLTLLARPLNTAIKNNAFAEKKPSYEQSDLRVTQALAVNDNWTFDEVEKRQEDLAAVAVGIWKFPE